MSEGIEKVSTVISEETHYDGEDWRGDWSKVVRIVGGKLAEDVQKKLNSSAPVLIKEYTYADGYSTLTHWDETEVTLICGDFEKEFKPTFNETIVTQIINWIGESGE